MADIPSWLQASAEVASATIGLGAAVAAWKSAKQSAAAATQSNQTSKSMVWIEKKRRHDELDPIRNGLCIKFFRVNSTSSFPRSGMMIKIDKEYKVHCEINSDSMESNWPPMNFEYDPRHGYQIRIFPGPLLEKRRLFESGGTAESPIVPHLCMDSILVSFTSDMCDCSIPEGTAHWSHRFKIEIDESIVI